MYQIRTSNFEIKFKIPKYKISSLGSKFPISTQNYKLKQEISSLNSMF